MDEPGRGAPLVAEDAQVAEVTTAVLTASRLLAAVATRSLAAVEDAITLPQFRLLVALAAHGSMNLVSLAEALAVNPSTATRMLDRLVGAGMVERQANPDSRREVVLRLTPRGRRMVDDVSAHRRTEIATIVARIPAGTRAALVEALRAFTAAGGEPPVPGEDPPLPGWS
jgi:DNA-binding MarR family transcriptional regulator